MIETVNSLIPVIVAYPLIGVAVNYAAGGRDPMDWAGPHAVLGWPIVAVVAVVGIAIMTVARTAD